jgi:hypothetical protein
MSVVTSSSGKPVKGLQCFPIRAFTRIHRMAASSVPLSSQQPAKLNLLQIVRLALRRGHYSYRTEQSYSAERRGLER